VTVSSPGEPTGAPVPRAGHVMPVHPVDRVHDLLPVAGVAGQRRLADLRPDQQVSLNLSGLQAIDAWRAVAGRPDADNALVGEQEQQAGHISRGGFSGKAKTACRPVRIPALAGVDEIEFAPLLAPVNGEGGRRDPTREGRHSVRPTTPD